MPNLLEQEDGQFAKALGLTEAGFLQLGFEGNLASYKIFVLQRLKLRRKGMGIPPLSVTEQDWKQMALFSISVESWAETKIAAIKDKVQRLM